MARRRGKQLVCQMLEKLNASALEDYAHIIRRYTRGRDGVYALYRNDKLYYVGLARNLQRRLKRHLKDRHHGSWNRFSVYLTIGNAFVKEMETLLLRIAQPKGNKQLGKFVKCQDLHRSVRRDFRSDYKLKEQSMFLRRRQAKIGQKSADAAGQPILAPYVRRGMALRAKRSGKEYKARVLRNGSIKFQGKIYMSPSGAGTAARGASTDGWAFWRYERAPGDWVPLKVLRSRR